MDSLNETIDNLSLNDNNPNNDMTLEQINERISKEYCEATEICLKDENMIELFVGAPSTKKKIIILKKVLEDHDLEEDLQKSIIKGYTPELIPAGTKGVIRGNKFEKIVYNYVKDMNLSKERFDIERQKCHHLCEISEIPDFYIYDKVDKKLLIFMIQIDLWSGGAQINRGYKYLVKNEHNTNNVKLVCIVCNLTKIANTNNKKYKLFNEGFTHNTLCYLKGLGPLINRYFKL